MKNKKTEKQKEKGRKMMRIKTTSRVQMRRERAKINPISSTTTSDSHIF
jgi:hypothetical protein